jgi:hypothetical protein
MQEYRVQCININKELTSTIPVYSYVDTLWLQQFVYDFQFSKNLLFLCSQNCLFNINIPYHFMVLIPVVWLYKYIY